MSKQEFQRPLDDANLVFTQGPLQSINSLTIYESNACLRSTCACVCVCTHTHAHTHTSFIHLHIRICNVPGSGRLHSGTCSATATLWREYHTVLDSVPCFPKMEFPLACVQSSGALIWILPTLPVLYIYPLVFYPLPAPPPLYYELKEVETVLSHPVIWPFFSSPGSITLSFNIESHSHPS